MQFYVKKELIMVTFVHLCRDSAGSFKWRVQIIISYDPIQFKAVQFSVFSERLWQIDGCHWGFWKMLGGIASLYLL